MIEGGLKMMAPWQVGEHFEQVTSRMAPGQVVETLEQASSSGIFGMLLDIPIKMI